MTDKRTRTGKVDFKSTSYFEPPALEVRVVQLEITRSNGIVYSGWGKIRFFFL
jgi:hypothetical protein